MSDTDWEADPRGVAEDHWVDLISEKDEQGFYWWHAYIKWDGCIGLSHAGNIPFGEPFKFHNEARGHPSCDDSFHICDIDDMIERLQKLKAAAEAHFGSDWPR